MLCFPSSLCSWGVPLTRHSALRKDPKLTQTSRKLPPLTRLLPTPRRFHTKGLKEERTSPQSSRIQPLQPHQCECTKSFPTSELSVTGCPIGCHLFTVLLPCRIMESTEEGDSEETAVSELRSELWLKERELTDIRLEALSSAHQLEQLRETMNNMHVRSLFFFCLSFFSHITFLMVRVSFHGIF